MSAWQLACCMCADTENTVATHLSGLWLGQACNNNAMLMPADAGDVECIGAVGSHGVHGGQHHGHECWGSA